eukprot:6617251-Pyramimonas_sp.AAC.1
MSFPRCCQTAEWWSAAVRHACRLLRAQTILPERWKTLSRGQQKKEIEYAEDRYQARETRDRAARRAWTRQDKQAQLFRTTTAGGPTWNTVERRISYDMDSGAVIRDEDVKGVTNKEILYANLLGGPRDITT